MTPPRFSVFTPSHKTRYLDECYASLRAQTRGDWEWVIVLNGNARWRPETPDERVRLVVADDLTGVGAAKRRACEEARGELLVELDHDDLLASTALERLDDAFRAHPEAALVYSDTAQITEDGGRDESRFDEAAGWEYDDVEVDGRSVLRAPCRRRRTTSPTSGSRRTTSAPSPGRRTSAAATTTPPAWSSTTRTSCAASTASGPSITSRRCSTSSGCTG
ncbi:glycosyltransferase [Agilicoccus flavus]|uniref:glycosyltransferase n=1 Tax=Agilicoccus flavus TaxID=2775968 RepID=UPI001CF65993|nr:glycosyltransferase [Agilicoccus flavus]